MSEVRLAWDANSEPDLGGYNLYAGRASGVYNAVGSPKNMGNVTAGGFDIDATGNWFFRLTAYDTEGSESAFSNEVTQFIVLGLTAGRGN